MTLCVFVKPRDGSPRSKEYRHVAISCTAHPLLRDRHVWCQERIEIGYLEYAVCTCLCHYVEYETAEDEYAMR